MLQPNIKKLKTCLLERKHAIVIKSIEEIPTLINLLASINVTQSRGLANIDTKMLHDWFYYNVNEKEGRYLCVRVIYGTLVYSDSLYYSRTGVTMYDLYYFRKEDVRVDIYGKKVIDDV